MCEKNNLRSAKPLSGDWAIKDILKIILEKENAKLNIATLTLVSHRPKYYSDEVFTYSMVQHFEKQTRVKSDHFYPQRTLSFDRISTGPWKSLNWLYSEFSLFYRSE